MRAIKCLLALIFEDFLNIRLLSNSFVCLLALLLLTAWWRGIIENLGGIRAGNISIQAKQKDNSKMDLVDFKLSPTCILQSLKKR